MKTVLVSIGILCCALLGCDAPDIIDDGGIEPASAIQAGNVDVAADVGRAVFDQPITITTSCMPLITGKGVVGLGGRKSQGEIDRIILSPTKDTVTLYQESLYTTYVPVEFKANQKLTQTWKVQLLQRTQPNGGSYFFYSHVHVDSIFIADSNRMYAISSDVARKYALRSRGWEPNGISSANIYLYP